MMLPALLVIDVQNAIDDPSWGTDRNNRGAEENIAFAPFFPLGGFTPLQSDALAEVASELGASQQQVALAWLLQRSPSIVVIPGTSSVEHLRENVAAAELELTADVVARLNAIGA